jgi:hypothetical protein
MKIRYLLDIDKLGYSSSFQFSYLCRPSVLGRRRLESLRRAHRKFRAAPAADDDPSARPALHKRPLALRGKHSQHQDLFAIWTSGAFLHGNRPRLLHWHVQTPATGSKVKDWAGKIEGLHVPAPVGDAPQVHRFHRLSEKDSTRRQHCGQLPKFGATLRLCELLLS